MYASQYAYYISVYPLHTRDTPSSNITVVLPARPPLYNANRDNYVPLRVFGFAVPTEKLLEYADRHQLEPNEDPYIQEECAWREIRQRELPNCWSKIAGAYYKKTLTLFIMFASNRSPEAMARADNVEAIQQFADLLRAQPEYYRPYDCQLLSEFFSRVFCTVR